MCFSNLDRSDLYHSGKQKHITGAACDSLNNVMDS